MIEGARRGELLHEAEGVASRLFAEGVKRNDLRTVIDSLLLSRGDWAKRVKDTERFVQHWAGSTFGGRGNPRVVREVVGPIIGRRVKEEEMLFLLGWAARLLRVLEEAAKSDRKMTQS